MEGQVSRLGRARRDGREHRPGAEWQLTDIEGAASYLCTSPRHVRRLVAERRLAFIKVGGRVRFDYGDLDAFLAAGRHEAVR